MSILPSIEAIVGPEVRVINPSPAIARQVERLLVANELRKDDQASGTVSFLTTGDPARLEGLLPKLTGSSGEVNKVDWDQLRLG